MQKQFLLNCNFSFQRIANDPIYTVLFFEDGNFFVQNFHLIQKIIRIALLLFFKFCCISVAVYVFTIVSYA